MVTLSATDTAIAIAAKSGTLSITDHFDRFGDAYVAINDADGMVEVHYSGKAARLRVKAIAPDFVG